VVYGSRRPESDKVQALVRKTGANASATTPLEAAQQADIVLTLVPWPAMETVAQSLGGLDGKIVIDVSMPFKQGTDGYPEHLLETSSAEMIQGWNPGAKVVKTFASLGSQVIDEPMVEGGLVSVPIASDHRDAKEKVAGIVAAMGLDPVDFGPLRMAREIEILQMIYMIPLVQNRPEHWEFYFRRSDHYGCYQSGESTSEGLEPPYDADDLALSLTLGLLLPTIAIAEKLTVERLFSDPSILGKAPSSLKISPDGSRVTFLRGKDEDYLQQDLWSYELASGETSMLVDSRALYSGDETLSDEEKARRERQRIQGQGIVEYHWSEDGQALVFPLNGDLYYYDLRKTARHLFSR
jgi:predicted dinucleotide-binding enzyme